MIALNTKSLAALVFILTCTLSATQLFGEAANPKTHPFADLSGGRENYKTQ